MTITSIFISSVQSDRRGYKSTPSKCAKYAKSICDIMRRGNRWNNVHITLTRKKEASS